MLKQEEIHHIEILKYEELSVLKIWPLVKETNDLFEYFPNYTGKQIPDRHYMFSVLWTLKFNIIKDIVSDARKKRSIHENDDKNQFVYIHKKLLEEISQIFSQKNKFWITNIKATKGKTTFLIKKSSKLTRNYKPRKKYQIDSKKFEDKEERKEKNEEDSMN